MAIWVIIFLLFYLTTAIAESPTRVLIINPYTQENTLNENLIVAQRYAGVCLTHSLASPGRKNAWRCIASNVILDPCFQDHDNLACSTSPWSSKIALLEPRSALPPIASAANQLTASHPWAIELANGQHCTFLTGASSVINRLRVNYTCGSYRYHILGELDRSKSTWKALFYDFDTKTLTPVSIAIAYY